MKDRGFTHIASATSTWVAALALVIMTLWTVADVITRYALS